MLTFGTTKAQDWPSEQNFNRSGLRWHTLETEHFRIHFHADENGKGNGRTAAVVARIAEEIYGPITSLYQYTPDSKVDFVLKDYEDYSNGAAYFFDNKIEIWTPALESPLRGDHHWLRNVITHEFTHIVQVQKTMRFSRKTPIFFFQYLGYENVRRPDVLYGYPNVVASYPVPIMNNPAWFAEGTAQFQRSGLHYETWDSHRDMLLRTLVLGNQAFSLAEMGSFLSKNSLGRELVYNHGFAFTQYLAQRFGEEVLREISAALAKHWNIEKALEAATGISGEKLHYEWISAMKVAYDAATLPIQQNAKEGETFEAEGFFNFHPRWSPDGKRVAYLSNKGYDFSATSLYVKDLVTNETTAFPVEGLQETYFAAQCSHGHRLQTGVSGTFSWTPDGKKIVFAKIKDTASGHLYSDLYELDLKTKKTKQLTKNQRAASPTISPNGAEIAFIQQYDGTTNLAKRTEHGEINPITTFMDGSQILDAQWIGDWIYFTKTEGGNPDLFRIKPDGTAFEPIYQSPHDERNVSVSGDYLYFSSDASGIFNLYRLPLNHLNEALPEALTNVLGGAFMPNVHPTGDILFARYEANGYKIAKTNSSITVKANPYSPPKIIEKKLPHQDFDWNTLNKADDRETKPLTTNTPLVKPYEPTFSKLGFIPVLRMDDYNSPARSVDATIQRSGTEELLRATKVGVMMTSREVLEGVNLYASALVAPASVEAETVRDFLVPSRLRKLERDLQMQLEYNRGASFLPKSWGPKFTLDVFNIQRIVPNGLTIEEFPCTACFPEKSYTDLTYTLWEVAINARSKLSRNFSALAGYKISPFNVRTESFYSREYQQTIGANSSRYFMGRGLTLQGFFEARKPTRHDHLLPEGVRASLTYEHQPGKLLDRYDIQDNTLVPIYKSYKINRLVLDAKYGMALGKVRNVPHGFEARLRMSGIFGEEVDDFFNDYVGGLIGARGYPFYAIGGNNASWMQVSYQFPIVPKFTRQWGFLAPDKLYGRVYADAATGWTGSSFKVGDIRKDAGAELRLSLGSFYLFPTAVFISSTYGFDQFDYQLKNRLTTVEGATFVTYGRQWLWHFGILFNFDL